jgi:hypothetical protein
MSQPPAYTPATSFTGSSPYRDASLGASMDVEFNAIKSVLDAIEANLALIQRDDTSIANQTIGPDQLIPALSVGFTIRGVWTNGTVYRQCDGVSLGTVLYRANLPNTATLANSPDIDATTWTAVADLSVIAGAILHASDQAPDGTAGAPGLGFQSQALGFYKKSAGVIGVSIAGVEQFDFTATGLTLPANPTLGNHAANKTYVDAGDSAEATARAAADTTETNARVAADALKAPLASPALTGTPTAPTAAPGTNTTQLATTAYADAIAALKANLASPTFTGDPKAPTPALSDNDTSIATTAFVRTGVADGSNAAAGVVGEYLSSTVLIGSEVSLSSTTAADVTSLALTAGDWDVTGLVLFDKAGGTTVTLQETWIGTASATIPTLPNGGAYSRVEQANTGGYSVTIPLSTRISVGAGQTIYLSAKATFASSTLKGYGFLGARRAR